nr:MAG TPA: hypothetical protein [Caudoviricetes sp.]
MISSTCSFNVFIIVCIENYTTSFYLMAQNNTI